MEQEEKLSLDFGNGEIYEVWLEVATYPADKNIKVCVFTEKEEEIWKLFELTTDMGIPLEKNQTFLLPGYDLEQIVEFIKKNGLGQLKEEICCSGCMEYPLFEFQEETLKKLDPEGYVMSADEVHMLNVVCNLIDNAIKYSHDSLNIYIYTKQEGNRFIIGVRDTGIGIPADKINEVFERFVKVNNFAQGTGLGLSICKTIIERLGGNISVTSEVGKGTTFTFVLPLESTSKTEAEKKEEDNQETTAETHSTEQRGKNAAPGDSPKNEEVGALPTPPSKTILIAEDTESNFILINAILGRLYRLKHAKDGMEAVTMFEEVHPDLILMDMKMPNLGGIDATRIIRELVPDVPIIALTAYAYEHDKQAALEAGCNDFLTKPFTQEVLKETIKKWLDDKG